MKLPARKTAHCIVAVTFGRATPMSTCPERESSDLEIVALTYPMIQGRRIRSGPPPWKAVDSFTLRLRSSRRIRSFSYRTHLFGYRAPQVAVAWVSRHANHTERPDKFRALCFFCIIPNGHQDLHCAESRRRPRRGGGTATIARRNARRVRNLRNFQNDGVG